MMSFFGKDAIAARAAAKEKSAAPEAAPEAAPQGTASAAAPTASADPASAAVTQDIASQSESQAPEAPKRKRVLDDDDDDDKDDKDDKDAHACAAPREARPAKLARHAERVTDAAAAARTAIAVPVATAGTGAAAAAAAADAADAAADGAAAAAEQHSSGWVSTFADEAAVPSPAALATAESAKRNAYDAVADAGWAAGQRVPYAAMAATFVRIEATSKRLETVELMCNFLRSVLILSPDDLLPCLYLCTNRVAPAFMGIELGVGESIIMKAIAEATGRQAKAIKADYEASGDLGVVAETSRTTQSVMFKPKPLTVQRVFDTLTAIANERGNSAMDRKKGKIKELLVSCHDAEARYVVRLCQGKLRTGCSEASVVAALAHACFLSQPQNGVCRTVPNTAALLPATRLQAELDESVRLVKEALCELPWLERVVEQLLAHGLRGLGERCFLLPGVPVKPMLAHPTKGLSEVLDRFADKPFTCEFKYDGERAQVHLKPDGTIQVYSRNSENNTSKYPDIIAMLPSVYAPGTEPPSSFVLDCEAVAYDRATKAILPFQVLSTRKRKDVDEADITVQVCLFAFDMLYLNGESLLRRSFAERREALYRTFSPREGLFMFATKRDATDTEEIQAFLEEAIQSNCEGLMVKTLVRDATYEPSRRSHKWLKVKKDYLAGLGDTLDLVVIGGFRGKGKRTGWYGGFLLACYDPDSEVYQSICKIGTGFSDADLEAHAAFFANHIIPAPRSYYDFGESVRPDVWFEPVQVWEVLAADLSISPTHRAALGLCDSDKGVSLRFPRFVRVREDKSVENATSAAQVAEMYAKQNLNKQAGADAADDDDDDEYM